MRRKILIAIICMISSSILSQTADNWELSVSKEGIQIFTRPVAGSSMKEIKAICTINAPVKKIYNILYDNTNYPRWFGDCTLQAIIEQNDSDTKFVYHVVDVPFPLSDRDVVAKCVYSFDAKAGKAVLKVMSLEKDLSVKLMPEKENMVRMTIMNCIFVATEIGPDLCHFIYQAHADPVAPLPGWVLNMFATNQPYKTLKNLQEYVK